MVITHPITTPWLVRSRPQSQPRCRLFCFPYAGGSASAFRTWQSELPSQIEVCAVQLPGREHRILEAPFTDLEALIDALTPVILPHLDLPCAFFGYSMGTLISFELARRLVREHGTGPQHLFVAARRAPHLPDTDPPLHQLPDDQFIAALRKFQGTPEEVLQNADLMRLLLPILRSDFAICETYRYLDGAPLDCPISLFGGVDDHHISFTDLIAWRKHTRRAFTPRLLPGGHFFLFSATAPLVRAIASDLQPDLQEPLHAEPMTDVARLI